MLNEIWKNRLNMQWNNNRYIIQPNIDFLSATPDWKKNELIKIIKENCVTPWEGTEKLWVKWKTYHINLPAKWEFKWFNFDYFISDKSYPYSTYVSLDKIPDGIQITNRHDLIEESKTIEKIAELLEAIRSYFKANWVIMDKNVNFQEDLLEEKFKYRCDTSDCLKEIMGLAGEYYINNNWKIGKNLLECTWKMFIFSNNWYHGEAKLLLNA